MTLPAPSLQDLLLLAAVLLAAGGLAYLLFLAFYARGLGSPPRLSDGKALARLGRLSPEDLGYAFETLTCLTPDRVTIVAWKVPADPGNDNGGLAVLAHGYADAKVGALAWAPLFRSMGYTLLLPDLRAHGESGGNCTTGGVREADDLALLIDRVRGAEPGRYTHLALFGASLGASAVARLASEPGLAGSTEGLRGVVLDSPVASFTRGALAHARLLAMPGGWLVRPAVAWASRRAGVDLDTAAVAQTLPRLRVAAMVVLPESDAYLTPEDATGLESACTALAAREGRTTVYRPSCPHLLGFATDPGEYAARVRRLFSVP